MNCTTLCTNLRKKALHHISFRVLFNLRENFNASSYSEQYFYLFKLSTYQDFNVIEINIYPCNKFIFLKNITSKKYDQQLCRLCATYYKNPEINTLQCFHYVIKLCCHKKYIITHKAEPASSMSACNFL